MSRSLGQPIIVENRTGASGGIAAAAAASSPPDGYTMLTADLGTYAMNPHLFSKLPYNSKRDLQVVGMLVNIPFVMFVPATLNVNTVAEFVAWVKSQPSGRVNFASSGLGTLHQMNMETFARKAGLQMTHVPYKGSTAAFPDVISGQVSAFMVGPNDGMPFVKAGKLKIIASATPKRLEILPDVPTLLESGYDAGYVGWVAVATVADTPPAAVERLNQALNDAMRLPEVTKRFTELGFMLVERSASRQADDFAKAQHDEWGTILRSFNIRLD
jgi:tripartite-type tricarboxylate transporter receptor subunit TctC